MQLQSLCYSGGSRVLWVPWNLPFEELPSLNGSIASVCKRSTQQRTPHLL